MVSFVLAILPLFGESAKAVAPMPYGALRAAPSGKRKLDCVGRSCRILAFGQDAPLASRESDAEGRWCQEVDDDVMGGRLAILAFSSGFLPGAFSVGTLPQRTSQVLLIKLRLHSPMFH